MKARVKATGEIIDVIPYNRDGFAYIQDDGETVYEFHELEILDDPDYWTRLEHQYAGMVMQGFLASRMENTYENVAEYSINQAHALVEKLKSSDL